MPPPALDATLPSIRLLEIDSWPWLAIPPPLPARPSVTRVKTIDSDEPTPTEMLPPSPLAGRPPWTVRFWNAADAAPVIEMTCDVPLPWMMLERAPSPMMTPPSVSASVPADSTYVPAWMKMPSSSSGDALDASTAARSVEHWNALGKICVHEPEPSPVPSTS